jgi:membrane protease YdiL (CAAX protease family)
LGWVWNGWRSILVGAATYAAALFITRGVTGLWGSGIPYSLPGAGGGVSIPPGQPWLLLALLVWLVLFVVVTVAGEETMFRGWIQDQVGQKYGAWAGLLAAAALFGLRHLPSDLFYAHLWQTTPQMWLSRQVELYLFALCLGLSRLYGRSTWASAIAHGLFLVSALFSLG